MNQIPNWLAVPAIIIPAAVSAPAFAVQYLTTEQAQKALFPDADRFLSKPIRLTAEQREFVERTARVKMRFNEQPVWQVMSGGRQEGWFMLDEVFGKHEFITYAVALDMNGTVQGVEILDYRETHGGQIRNDKWRAQFSGKRYGAPLKLDEDVLNISGATLSCKHISEGVRRLLAIHEATLK